MEILVVNDDGVLADGIVLLARRAKKYGHVTVVAPAAQCSAMSHRVTIGRPLEYSEVAFPVADVRAFQVDGTPADCVKAALEVILSFRPDVIFSGINCGYNVGYDIIYSGTIGAAMEGRMNGIPAFAFSRCDHGSDVITEQYFDRILETLLPLPISRREIWNVNFPGCAPEEFRGIRWDRTVGHEEYYNARLEPQCADGRTFAAYPPLGEMTPENHHCDPDSDVTAVLENRISVGKVTCPVL